MADQVTGLNSLEDLAFEQRLQERIAAKRRRQVDEHSESLLLWLALAPAWPRAYVEAGFPTAGGLVTGPAAAAAVDRAVNAGLAHSGTNDADPGTPIYWMTQAQTDSVLAFFLDQPRGPERILSELTAAAQAVRRASTRLPLPVDLDRWCRLGEAGPRAYDVATFFDREIDAAVARAESAQETSCPDARRWIETATPIATLFPGPLRVSLMRANRRFELFHRRAADKRHLANFLPRQSQIDDFHQLMQEREGPWALHYVGSGGAGKTMLIRHITADLAPQLGLATARIDFDHLNPDYPTREPALLLAALAEELRLYERTSHSGFDYFYSAVNTLHESVDASGGTGGGEGAMQRIGPALTAFVDAIRKLEMRPLFILDTCEELAKLRPDGQIPDNVRVTFDILEELHRALPELRVVFSGRRPLACEGAGWRSRDVLLPKRDYLRLHVVRGFTREEALAFLQAFREREHRLDPSSFEDILARSPATDVTFAQRFEVDDRALMEGERYNPYDLAMFASLAAAGQLTSGVGAHFYVKERIVDRLPSSLVMLVPALVKVGTFDRALINDLCVRLNVEQRPTLADELAQQHWIGRVTTAAADDPMWTCDPIHRKRLLAYYGDEESETMVDADRALLAILPALTIDRSWRNLSIAYFDATLQLLQRDIPRALTWWQRVEEKIAVHAEWDWAQRMTAQLLASEDGSWEEAAEKLPDALLRASILTTHAAASARMRRSDDDSVWRAVLKAVEGITDLPAVALRRRAIAGMVHAAQWAPEDGTIACDRVLMLLTERFPAPAREVERAAEVALLEGAVEILERVPSGTPSAMRLVEILEQRHVPDNEVLKLFAPLANLPFRQLHDWSEVELSEFRMSLLGRLAVLRGNIDDAEQYFRMSLTALPAARSPYLDWTPPEDPPARLKLEAIRGLALRFDVRKMLVDEECQPGDSLDSDRLASAVLIVRTANDRNSRRTFMPRVRFALPTLCNAHRLIPSYFSTSVELAASGGDVDAAMKTCSEAMTGVEVSADVLMQNDIARAAGRLICRYRLFERGEKLSPLIVDSGDPKDRELTMRFVSMAVGDAESARDEFHRSRSIEARRPWQFDDVWTGLADRKVSPDEALKWAAAPQAPPVQALRIVTRVLAVETGEWHTDDLLVAAGERVGRRRAAEIVLEECESAAISDRLRSAEPLSVAAGWFAAANEPLGTLRANVLAVLAQDTRMTAATIAMSIPSDLPFPRPEQVMSVIQSPRRVDELIETVEGSAPGLRPWTMRLLAACFMANRNSAVPARMREWLADTRKAPLGKDLARMVRVRPPRIKTPDISRMSQREGAAVIVFALTGVIWLLAKFFAWSSDAVKGGLALLIVSAVAFLVIKRKETRAGLLGLLFFSALWLGLYLFVNNTPFASVFGERWSFINLFAFDALLGVAGYGLLRTRGLKAVLESARIRLARSIEFPSSGWRMKLRSWIGPQTYAVNWRTGSPLERDLEYVLLHAQLMDDTAAALNRWQSGAGSQPLPAHIQLDTSRAAGLCWEAVFDPALFGDDERRSYRFAPYRTLPTGLAMHQATQSTVLRIASSYPASEQWSSAMVRVPNDRFAHAERGDHAQVHHLVGQPSEVREGIRLELGDGDRRSDLLRPDFVRAWPNLVFCIVQGRPNEANVRTATDRVIASQLRAFGAEVFVSGVPLVLVIPPLPTAMADDVAARIASAVVREQLTDRESVLSLVDTIRQTILRSTSDAAIEQAYDVCVYLHHVPELRPRRRARFIRPWTSE